LEGASHRFWAEICTFYLPKIWAKLPAGKGKILVAAPVLSCGARFFHKDKTCPPQNPVRFCALAQVPEKGRNPPFGEKRACSNLAGRGVVFC
jgi:hypothetical protein